MRYLYILLVYLGLPSLARAQQTEVYSFNIHTVRVIANDDYASLPVIALGSDEYVEISFDRLSHQYHRYRYEVVLCNADWSASGMNEIDYLDGFNNNPVEDYETSRNTMVEYTHYKFVLPNDQVKMKLSGNYAVTVVDEDSNQPVFKTGFRIVENRVTVTARVSSNTDIDRNRTNQQVSFTINHGGYTLRNPQNELKVQVLQNRRTDNMATGIFPSYIGPSELRYEHNRNLIFPAGNEYRRFEIIYTRHNSLGVDRVWYEAPYYRAMLYPDRLRTANYIYDQDQNGRFLIRNAETDYPDTEADYVQVHFSIPWPNPLANGHIYLLGDFTHNNFGAETEMRYNPDTESYESVQLLKQGAYNYLYVYVPEGSRQGQTALVEGNYFQTENEYAIFVYHRPFGERYDKIIGHTLMLFK